MSGTIEQIQDLIKDVERSHNVEVLLAVESGSRAWGFESPDSDFDIRMVYRESPEAAFQLNEPRDVIEIMSDVEQDGQRLDADLVGWSLRKALRLGVTSNPQMMEWVQAPIIYHKDPAFAQDMAQMKSRSDPRTLANHYRGLARRTLMQYIHDVEDPVGKKYLYAVRCVCAARWMVQNPVSGAVPPVAFCDLLGDVNLNTSARKYTGREIRDDIAELIEWKVQQTESGGRRRFDLLNTWISDEVTSLEEDINSVPEYRMGTSVGEEIWKKWYPEIFTPPAHEPNSLEL